MRFVSVAILAGSVSALALAGFAPAANPPAPPPTKSAAGPAEIKTLSCDGPFSKDASEASLKEAFGPENVVFKSVPGAEGMESNATVIFPNDPARTVTVFWYDEEKRQRPATIQVEADYASDPEGTNPWKTEILWQSAQGLRIGSTLEEVETINGKPFQLSGFGWDYGGYATSWEGGKLDTVQGGCGLSVRFAPTSEAPETVAGDTTLTSDGKDVRAAKPRVSELSIGYAEQ